MWQAPHLASPPHLWVNFSPEAMIASRMVEPSAASTVLPDGLSVTIGISLLHCSKNSGSEDQGKSAPPSARPSEPATCFQRSGRSRLDRRPVSLGGATLCNP